MSLPLDSVFLLWIVGIWQPIQPSELAVVASEVLKKQPNQISEDDALNLCRRYEKDGLLVQVHRKPFMYSLSERGNQAMSEELRRARDKNRLFLLRRSNRDLLESSYDDGPKETGDGASSDNKDEGKSIKSGESSRLLYSIPPKQICWPRHSQQLLDTGETTSSYDATLYPKFLSFFDKGQIAVARGIRKRGNPQYEESLGLNKHNLALMLGISVQLIDSITLNKKRHYHSFEIPKKSGDYRQIDGPRVFLKVIQRFLLDYYLSRSLPIHDTVHSFTRGKSVVDNATVHQGKAFVGTIDIENFFGSITIQMLFRFFKKRYSIDESLFLADLCTKDDVLPQGAPTSPILSNAILYDFDSQMDELTKTEGLTYSRYADDLTISGDDKQKVKIALHEAESILLRDFALKINKEKTRIVSAKGRQMVNGLVINEKIQPSRHKRHFIRSKFHHASKRDNITLKELGELSGYYGYLSSIPVLKDSKHLTHYKSILTDLRRKLVKEGD